VLFGVVLWLVEASGLLVPYREGGFALMEQHSHVDEILLAFALICLAALCVFLWTIKHPLCEKLHCDWCKRPGCCDTRCGNSGSSRRDESNTNANMASASNVPLLAAATGL
jgi:hypothetical protein